jgi:hypothetical protein
VPGERREEEEEGENLPDAQEVPPWHGKAVLTWPR